MIDLHLHTTASDGRCTPTELVARAARAGLTVMAVSDHDTTAAVAEVHALAAAAGIHAISGIEITAVENQLDVHVLGYFIDADDEELQRFLVSQRASRIDRVEQIVARLDALGMPLDVRAVIADARAANGQSIGRPQIARAMMAAGYVSTVNDAFDQWLGRGCRAFVPRMGPSPEAVVETIHAARGIASLAHPGRTRIDERLPALRDAGLDALEAFHSDHAEPDRARYLALARSLGMQVTGGSDFHGDPARGIEPGGASLPFEHWTELIRSVTHRA